MKGLVVGFAVGAAALLTVGSAYAQNDYECYKVKKDVVTFPTSVTSADQFGSQTLEVKKAFLECNPADVDGEGPPPNPANHLLCFKVKGNTLNPAPHLSMTNDFGNSTLFAKKPFLVCMDSTKTIIP